MFSISLAVAEWSSLSESLKRRARIPPLVARNRLTSAFKSAFSSIFPSTDDNSSPRYCLRLSYVARGECGQSSIGQIKVIGSHHKYQKLARRGLKLDVCPNNLRLSPMKHARQPKTKFQVLARWKSILLFFLATHSHL